MSRIPLIYHTHIKFYTQYTHPMLICRGMDARTDGRTENIYSIFRDKLLPNELHSGLKYPKVWNTYKKSYPSRVQRYGTKNSCLWLAFMSAHVSKIFTLQIFCYTYIHRNSIVQKNVRRRNWYSLDTFWVCVVVVSWRRIDMVEIEQNVMALRNQNFWRMKNSWWCGVDKAESLPHADI